MASPLSNKRPQMELPDWIFRWRNPGDDLFPKFAALLICGAAFSVFLTMVRVRVVPPMQPEGKKASLIYLNPGPEAAAWAMRAKEGGPFPARFEPSAWPGVHALEEQVYKSVRLPLQSYEPRLRDLPAAPLVTPVLLADRDERVFPITPPKTGQRGNFTPVKLSPVLYPLSNITPAELPESLPPFDAPESLSSNDWRMLIRLRADGSVAECVALTGDSSPASSVLEGWMQSVRFRPVANKQSLWISIGLGLVNKSVTNGSLPH